MADKELGSLTAAGAYAGADKFLVQQSGSSRVGTLTGLFGGIPVPILPATSDLAALGSVSLMWADLFLASGGVINWNAGAVVLTHSLNTLTLTGATAFSFGTGTAVTLGTIEVGATDTTLSRSSAGILAVEGSPVALLGTEDQVITGGAQITSKSLGTISSGTVTPDPGDRPMQHYTNGGAHTLAPSAINGAYLLDITNNGSAGAITTSGWTKVAGSFTTTNAHKFRCHCSIGNAGSLLVINAFQ